MKTLFLFFIFLLSSVLFAQQEDNRTVRPKTETTKEEVNPERQDAYAEETDPLIQENDDLRAQLDEAQQNCNCDQQREEYVSEREQVPPVVIINETPVQQQPQQQVQPPVEAPQFNNNQYSEGIQYQYTRPNPEKPVDDFFMLLKPGT